MTSESVFQRIVVPTDFSGCAEEAWALAQRMGGALGSELVLTHVLVETPLYEEGPFSMERTKRVYEAARKWAEESIEHWAGAARSKGLKVRTVLRTGVPYREIVALATDERADLVLMGTHGPGAGARRLRHGSDRAERDGLAWRRQVLRAVPG